jgi:hypothetical protein
MRYKFPIIFSIIFVFLFLNLVSAHTWTQFGTDYQPLTQSQYSSVLGNIENNTISTITYGYDAENTAIPYQPLASYLGEENKLYLIFQNGNFLQVYDTNLDLITEIYTLNKGLGNIAVTDFDKNGVTNDIVGWYRTETNNMSFRAYKFESNSLSLIHSFNTSFENASGVAGVRCQAGECYSIIYNVVSAGTNYSLTLIFNNYTGYTAGAIGKLMGSIPLEPLAKQDINNNGIDDFLVFSKKDVFVIDKNYNILFNYSIPTTYSNVTFAGAKFIRGLNSPYWQIAILKDWQYSASYTSCLAPLSRSCSRVEVYKLADGSFLWQQDIQVTAYIDTTDGLGLAIDDYNNDNYDDIFVSTRSHAVSDNLNFAVLKGADGSSLVNRSYTMNPAIANTSYPNSQMVIGNLDYDNDKDMVVVAGDNIFLYSPSRQVFLYNATSIGGSNTRGCIIADLDYNSKNDVICSSTSWTKVWFSNYINLNAYITSVSFSPSISIQISIPLYIYINASDFEGDNILYSIKCSNDVNWSSEDGSSVKTCSYSNAGVYNLTIRVRDGYHSTYDAFSQDIIVTETGTMCGNDICEAGENNVNCPVDCPYVPEQQQSNETGGMPLPTKIVDTENTEQGLLPEIYYGILGFLSNTLSPMIILIFVIFFVLIILAIGFIIKKIFHRVGEIAR